MLFARPLAPLGGNQRSRTPEICPVAGIAPALAASIIWDNRNLNGGQARNHSGIIRVCASPSQPGFFLSTSPRLGADCPRGFRSLTDRKPVIGRIGFRRQAGNKQDVQVMQHSPVLDTRVPDIDLELSGEAWVARYFPYRDTSALRIKPPMRRRPRGSPGSHSRISPGAQLCLAPIVAFSGRHKVVGEEHRKCPEVSELISMTTPRQRVL